MAQQTAVVDWLREQYVYITWMVNRGELPIDASFELILKRFDQAYEMFEEQIKNAFDNGDHCIDLPDGGWEQKYKSAEQYYNETYKKVKP